MLCDRAALTKPCGNYGAADRSGESMSRTDGQNVGDRETANQQERASKWDMKAVACVSVCSCEIERRVLRVGSAWGWAGCVSYFCSRVWCLPWWHILPRVPIPPAFPAATDTPIEEGLHFQSVMVFTSVDPVTAQPSPHSYTYKQPVLMINSSISKSGWCEEGRGM